MVGGQGRGLDGDGLGPRVLEDLPEVIHVLTDSLAKEEADPLQRSDSLQLVVSQPVRGRGRRDRALQKRAVAVEIETERFHVCPSVFFAFRPSTTYCCF
jgi:hypothetical protein